CEVVDGMNGIGDCTAEAPPDSFDPEVQWSWNGGSAIVTPLVINLTDDDGDGNPTTCDIPDIVVVTEDGVLHVLDGATGGEHFTIGQFVSGMVTPAVGDIDGDGLPEIVAGVGGILGPLAIAAFEHDGTFKWQTEPVWDHDQGGAIAIADLDNDQSPEIIADGVVVNADGSVRFEAPAQTGWFIAQRSTATLAADLDGDGDLEVVLGQSAYHHDGSLYYEELAVAPGYPQVAELDGDGNPEIIITNDNGITILEHDGTIKNIDVRPTGDPPGLGAWFRPATVHDFDGDEVSEFAVSSAASYSVFEPNLLVNWTSPVQDGSGWAAGTAFDFLGDGGAEAMYADEATLFVFDDSGSVLLSVPRSSRTLIEYPVVADVDNDGSAEIVVVSGNNWDDMQTAPTVQVIRDAEDRWIQARRIWNQHTYHVTNVREDGTIPAFEPPSWAELNTYRTNAQIEDGEVCKPPPEG
ncbi:MAG: VCBS repeat-containing protein, partial [Deltaproteobacteria bacterium]|nr:VCBS repeat-containing protein [Deltaproteobacteria bacterium]